MMRRGAWPEGEALRQAVRWLSERGVYDLATVEEAARRFDLSPADEEFLLRHFVRRARDVRSDDRH